MLAAAGITRVVLTERRSEALDDTYVLARTEWRGERAAGNGAAAPVRLASTFLVRRDGEGLCVVLYLDHQDPRSVLSSASGAGPTSRARPRSGPRGGWAGRSG